MRRQEWFERRLLTYSKMEHIEQPIPSITVEDWKQTVHMIVKMAIDHLPDMERRVLTEIYVNDTSPTATAREISVTVQWVNALRRDAISRLKVEVAEQTSLLGLLCNANGTDSTLSANA